MKEVEFNAIPKKDRFNRTLDGIAYWARVHKPYTDEKYNTTTFKVTLGLDKENQDKARSYGLKVFDADKSCPIPYVILKRKVKEGVDPSEVAPEVVDSVQKTVPSSYLIGNGSKVRCKFFTYWAKSNNTVQPGLTKVQVLELVKYENKTDKSLMMDEGGFHIDESEPSSDDDFDDSEAA